MVLFSSKVEHSIPDETKKRKNFRKKRKFRTPQVKNTAYLPLNHGKPCIIYAFCSARGKIPDVFASRRAIPENLTMKPPASHPGRCAVLLPQGYSYMMPSSVALRSMSETFFTSILAYMRWRWVLTVWTER